MKREKKVNLFILKSKVYEALETKPRLNHSFLFGGIFTGILIKYDIKFFREITQFCINNIEERKLWSMEKVVFVFRKLFTDKT